VGYYVTHLEEESAFEHSTMKGVQIKSQTK